MKFRLKMTVCMVWLLALTCGIGSAVLVGGSFRAALEREKLAARRTYQMTVSAMQTVNDTGDHTGAADAVRTLEQMSDRIGTGWAGLRLEKSGETLLERGPVPDVPADAPEASPTSSVCAVLPEQQTLLYRGQLLCGGETVELTMAFPLEGIYADRAQMLHRSRGILLAVLAAGAVCAWALSYLLTRPLRGLSFVSRSLAEGDLSCRAQYRGRDELGSLSSDFNHMADRLQEDMDELQGAMHRQEEFMGSFAHEMKTPMTSIIGYADLMRSQMLSPEEERQAANYIFSEGRRLENLSMKLLDILVLKKKALSLSPQSPAQIIETLAKHLRPIYEQQNIRISTRCEAGVCPMDADLVRSLLVNLIDNARKALDGGGNIAVLSRMTAEGCVLKVYDNGRGIPAEALEHLTESFYRVDKSRSRAQGGVGLGLALCQEIAALHGGTITFDSEEGRGTCVTVTLKGGRA